MRFRLCIAERGIYYCSNDDFCTGNIEKLKKTVLFATLEKYLSELPYLNAKELVKHIYEETRIEASSKEIENFYNKYIKTLRLKFSENGEVRFEIMK